MFDLRLVIEVYGKSKVYKVDVYIALVIRVYHYVAGFDISVDDVAHVNFLDYVNKLDCYLNSRIVFQWWSQLQKLLQRLLVFVSYEEFNITVWLKIINFGCKDAFDLIEDVDFWLQSGVIMFGDLSNIRSTVTQIFYLEDLALLSFTQKFYYLIVSR